MAVRRLSQAIDLYLGDLARRGRRPATLRSYERLLWKLWDDVRGKDVDQIELVDYETFLNRWIGAKPATQALSVSLVRGFSQFLWERGYTETDVAYPIRRPKRPRPEDLHVVTVTGTDVGRMLEACEDWQELLCVGTAAYLGARRNALATVRLSDVDLERRTIRFAEEGGEGRGQADAG